MPHRSYNSRTGVVDRIEHDDPANLKYPAVVLLMADERVELYAAPDGFGGPEEYAGTLQGLRGGGKKSLSPEALFSILKAIRERVCESPMSLRSYYWLRALYPSGLLGAAEDNLPPR